MRCEAQTGFGAPGAWPSSRPSPPPGPQGGRCLCFRRIRDLGCAWDTRACPPPRLVPRCPARSPPTWDGASLSGLCSREGPHCPPQGEPDGLTDGQTHRQSDSSMDGQGGMPPPSPPPAAFVRGALDTLRAGPPPSRGPAAALRAKLWGAEPYTSTDAARPPTSSLLSTSGNAALYCPRGPPCCLRGSGDRGIYTLESILPLFCDPPPHSVGSSPGVVWGPGPPLLPPSHPPFIYVSVYKSRVGSSRWGAEQCPPAPPPPGVSKGSQPCPARSPCTPGPHCDMTTAFTPPLLILFIIKLESKRVCLP